MPRNRRPTPPIRVGSRAVTYTPPGPDDASRYDRLVFRCEIVHMTLDGQPVDSIEGDRDYQRHDVRADLRLPDGADVLGVPYTDQGAEGGSSWCRPYITSISAR